MKDAVAKADDGAQLGIAGAREANNFTTQPHCSSAIHERIMSFAEYNQRLLQQRPSLQLIKTEKKIMESCNLSNSTPFWCPSHDSPFWSNTWTFAECH
jgi:hypothetical protein